MATPVLCFALLISGIAIGSQAHAFGTNDSIQDPDGLLNSHKLIADAIAKNYPGDVGKGRVVSDFSEPNSIVLNLDSIDWSPTTGHFTAVFNTTTRQVQVYGEAHAVMTIAVANRRLERGMVLDPSDIGLKEIPASNFKDGTLTNRKAAIGHLVTETVASGDPLPEEALGDVPPGFTPTRNLDVLERSTNN